MTARDRRERALEALVERRFDLLVVGGGIVGSRVAYDAARAGLSVALVDAGDFAAATSSASSKFVHGGLRYLSMGSFGLVRAAQHERAALLQAAGGLVRPMPVVLAVRRGEHARSAVRAGLLAYAALGARGDRRARMLEAGNAQALVPDLAAEDICACALLPEAQTNDARLTLDTVARAGRAGAVVANHVRLVEFSSVRGRIVGAMLSAPEGSFALRCRAVLNATGPWVDAVRTLEDPACRPITRLSKGAHVVLPSPPGWRAGVAVNGRGGRTTFAVPWHGMLLVGTTDSPYHGEPSDVHAADDDVAGLLREVSTVVGERVARRDAVRFAFAGLRVLPRGRGDTTRARRDHLLAIGRGGVVSAAGGKLTLHRRISLDVLRVLPHDVRPRTVPAEEPRRSIALPRGLEPELRAHLLAVYGASAGEVAALAADDPWLLTPVRPDGPDIWAQVRYAVEREWALSVDDVARRRTTIAIRGTLPAAVRAELEHALGAGVPRGWPQPLTSAG